MGFYITLCTVHTTQENDRDQKMMGFYITLCTVHTTQGQGNDGFLYYAMYCTHYTGTGTSKRWVSILHYVLYTLHGDRDQETMGFYITLCTVHSTQEQGHGQATIAFYCVHPSPGPGPVQCVSAIRAV